MATDNIFTKIDEDAASPKVTLGKEMLALRVSVETNARILRKEINRLKEILAVYGVNGTSPLLNANETLNIKETIQFLIYGGGEIVMARVDGLPFEGVEAIITEAKTLVT